MDLMQSLQGLFNQLAPSESRTAGGKVGANPGVGTDGFSSLLGPTALGGIAGALLSGKGVGGLLKGALLGGGGAYLWDKYKNRIKDENAQNPKYAQSSRPAPTEDRAVRMIRALVFAAKADGRIDDNEKAAISEQIRELNAGPQATQVVQEAMNQPLDPKMVADGVSDPEEALQIFTVSCASVDTDNFMVKSYLDALASALNIPQDVKADLMDKVKTPA